MGKSKRRSKASRSRLNPLQAGSLTTDVSSSNSALEKKVRPLLLQLRSKVPNDRSLALSATSVMCEDSALRKMFLKEKLVHLILEEFIADRNIEIVVEAYGLLRNLALEEGYDVSVFLWRNDIWQNIVEGLKQVSKSLESMSSGEPQQDEKAKESRRLLFEFCDNLLSLLVALCNGSDDILLKVTGQHEYTAIVFDALKMMICYGLNKMPLPLVNTILDLIYDFSSESYEFIEAATGDDIISEFIKELPNYVTIGLHHNELTLVLIQGIILQFLDLSITNEQANSIIHKSCDAISGITLKELSENLNYVIDDNELSQSQGQAISKIKEYTMRRYNAMTRLQSIEIVLDILTAIVEILASLKEDPSVTFKLVKTDPLYKTLTTFIPQVLQSLFNDFASRVLIAWNNMLWLYISIDFDFARIAAPACDELWTKVSNGFINETDKSLITSKLGVMWALLKTFAKGNSEEWFTKFRIDTDFELINKLIHTYKNEEDLDIKERCCGVLACIAQHTSKLEVNSMIGKFLIGEMCNKAGSPKLLADITFLIFELYGDTDKFYNRPVFVELGFLDTLKSEVLPNLKSRFKLVDKNKDALLKERCTDSYNNLNSFIQYKSHE